MNLGLSIDALSSSGDESWRLQTDLQHWEHRSFAENLCSGDAMFSSPDEVERWVGQRMKIDKTLGLKPIGRPGILDFWMRGIFTYPIVHRFSASPIPEKEQMLNTLATMTPGTARLLYLDLGGHFRSLDSTSTKIIGNMAIAVRGEIASSANYIGPQAIANERLMDEMYRQYLAGWIEHLKSRRLAIFIPDAEKLKDERTLKHEIHLWEHE